MLSRRSTRLAGYVDIQCACNVLRHVAVCMLRLTQRLARVFVFSRLYLSIVRAVVMVVVRPSVRPSVTDVLYLNSAR